MSRLTNLTTLRIGTHQSWSSSWYESDVSYSKLIFNDIYVNEYIQGIFYKLKLPTTLPRFRDIGGKNLVVYLKAFIYSKTHRLPYLFVENILMQCFAHKAFILIERALQIQTISKEITKQKKKSYLGHKSILHSKGKNKHTKIKVQFKTLELKTRVKDNLFLTWLVSKLFHWHLLYMFLLFLTLNIGQLPLKKQTLNFLDDLSSVKSNLVECLHCHQRKPHSMNLVKRQSQLRTYIKSTTHQVRKRVNWIRRYYHLILLNHLHCKMEYSLSTYLGREVKLSIQYRKKNNLELVDAKQINDYVRFNLESEKPLIRTLKQLMRIQSNENRNKIKLLVMLRNRISNSLDKMFRCLGSWNKLNPTHALRLKKMKSEWSMGFFTWEIEFQRLYKKKFPLQGLRVECNGPSKKGMMSKLVMYHLVVNDYKLPGRMPNQTILSDVQYWQSYARTKKAGMGIKVWIYMHSPLYNAEDKHISI